MADDRLIIFEERAHALELRLLVVRRSLVVGKPGLESGQPAHATVR